MLNVSKAVKSRMRKVAHSSLALALGLMLLVEIVPPGSFYPRTVNAVKTDSPSIPVGMFATRDELMSAFTLENGDSRDVVGRIALGRYDADVEYFSYFDDNGYVMADNFPEKGNQITWLIAGSESAADKYKNTVVLYSEQPLVGANYINMDDKVDDKVDPSKNLTGNIYNSRFTLCNKEEEEDSYPSAEDMIPTKNDPAVTYHYVTTTSGMEPSVKVHPNDYRASNLCGVLNALSSSTDYFTKGEQSIMASSTVETNYADNEGAKKAGSFRTTSKLYAPSAELLSGGLYHCAGECSRIFVGESSQNKLPINMSHWAGVTWTRSPCINNSPSQWLFNDNDNDINCYAIASEPRYGTEYWNVCDTYNSIAAATKIDLSHVLFSSAANTTEGFTELSMTEAAMKFRLEGIVKDLGIATFKASGSTVDLSKVVPGTRLMVQGITEDGTNWSYCHNVKANDTELTVNTIMNNSNEKISTLNFDDCEVWIEKDGTGDETGLIYACMASHPVQSITLNKSKMNLPLLSSETLNTSIFPDNATNKGVKWSSNNTKVATVDASGKVTGESVGTAEITASALDGSGVWAACLVNVTLNDMSRKVSANGTTSVGVDQYGIIWLKEESGDTSAWYGLDNTEGVFELGSRFWVRWLNQKNDDEE